MFSKMKKSLLILLAFAISMGIIGANPNQKLVVNAKDHGEYYDTSVNEDSDFNEKEVTKENVEAPNLRQVEKSQFETLTMDGYVEDLSQREEAVKVFVKGDEEKRLYFMAPVHTLVNGQWEDINTAENYARFISNMKNEDVILFSERQFDEITPTDYGFIGSKTIDVKDIIPFEISEGYKVRLSESKTHVEILNEDDSINHLLTMNLKGEEYEGTALSVILDLHDLENGQYGISLSSENTFASSRSFDVDLKSEQYKLYNNGEVSLFGVRNGASYMNNSYNPGGFQSIDNAVIGNASYNNGYILCTGDGVCQSDINWGIVSFYNQRNFKDVIGKRRTVTDSKLHLSYNTNQAASDGSGLKFQAFMLDPSKNFDVSDPHNITYNKFQNYLDNSAAALPFEEAITVWNLDGTMTFNITEIMQSWENSGNHHGIQIKAVSNATGGPINMAQRVLNHVYSPEINKRPYIEITTVKEEPVPDNYPLKDTTLTMKPFTVNKRSLNVLQFSALGFDGVTKPGSVVKVDVKDNTGNVIFTDSTVALDGYRAFPQYTKQLGYNLAENTQTYYRLTSNYQEPHLLYNTGSNLKFNHLYKVSYESTYGTDKSGVKNGDEFILVKLSAYDRLPRLLAFYGVTNKTQFMQDNNMSDDLLVEGNVVFIRNPKKNKEKVYTPADLDENDKRMIDNNLLGRNQHCVYGYEPINFNTGNFIYSNPDTGSIDYDKEVLFERYYNSLAKGRVGVFGRNWTFELYKELFFRENGDIEFSDGTGRILTFEKEDDHFKTPFDSNYTIEKFELSRETIKVDNGYYDQDDPARQENKVIIKYGYIIKDNATHEEMKFDEVGNIISHKRSQYDMPLTYTYNKDHVLEKIITPAQREFTFTFNSLGLISEIKDPKGNTTNYNYDEDLNLIEFSDQKGYKINYTYDDNYRMLSYTGRESDDLVIQNTYDQDGKIVAQIDALNQKSQFAYFTDRTEITNYKGDITIVYKDGQGYTTRVVEELIDDCIKVYDDRGNLISETLPTGETLTYTYNEKNQVVSETNKFNQTKTKVYDTNGNVTSITDFNGDVSTFVYDSENRLTESHYPNGTSEIKQYNNQNQVIFEKDMYGLEKTKTYTNGSLTSVAYNDGTSISYSYDELGNLASKTDESNQTVSYHYDERSLLYKTDYANHSEEEIYNGDGELVSRVDGNGNRTNYIYDGWSRVIEEVTSSGSIKYTYDENGNVLSTTDRMGYTSYSEYDLQDRKIKDIDVSGLETHYEYDDKGSLIKTINPLGQETLYEYNDKNQRVKETFIDRVTTFEYDQAGNLVKTVNPFEEEVINEYDQNNLLIKTIDENGYVSEYTYFGTRLMSKTYKDLVWEYEYDLKGNKTKEIDPLLREKTSEYLGNGQTDKTSTGSLISLSSEYDQEGRISKIIDVDGNVKSFEYDANGNTVKEIDANGNVTEHKYDSDNRVIETITPEGYKSEFTYDLNGNLLKTLNYDVLNNTIIETNTEYNPNNSVSKEIDSLGRETTYTYDDLGRQVEVNQNGRITKITYDEYGNKIKEVNHLKEIDYTYNDKGLLEKTEDSLGYSELNIYDDKKQVIEVIDENGLSEKKEYNDLGHLVKTINHRNLETQYEVNALEETIKSIDPFGVVTTYLYNDAGQVIETHEGNYSLTYDLNSRGAIDTQKSSLIIDAVFEYDKNLNITKMTIGDYTEVSVFDKENRLVESIDALGNSTKYRYNILNQIVETEYPDGTTEQTVYDNAGRKIQEIDQLGFVSEYVYDDYDNLIESTDQLGNKTSYTYDDKDNQIKMIEPLNKVTKYAYDERSRQIEVVSPNKNKTKTTYTDFDEVESIIYPNGLTKVFTYNEYQEVLTEGFKGRKPETTYDYDEYGRVSKQIDQYGKAALLNYDIYGNVLEVKVDHHKTENVYDDYSRLIKEVDERGLEKTYTYNEYNQLESLEDSLGYKEEYVYDHLGQEVEVITALGSTHKVYDEMNRVVEVIDVANNSTFYEYDERGLEVKVINPLGIETSSEYDELGRKIKSINELGVEEVFEYNELNQVVKYQKDNQMIIEYTYDKENNLTRLGYEDNLSELRSYDNMNQLVSINNMDGTLDTYKYDLYGNVLEEVITNRKTNFEYDDYDQMIKRVAGDDTYTFTYNKWGLLESAYKNDLKTELVYSDNLELKEVRDANDNIVKYHYDLKGRQTSIVYPSGKYVQYEYDEFDRLTTVKDQDESTEYTYDNASNLILEKTGSLVTERTYDKLGQLISQEVRQDDDILNTLVYTRNEFGDVLTEVLESKESKTQKSYTYDNYNQVIQEITKKDNQKTTLDLTYDKWGNKTKEVKQDHKGISTKTYTHNFKTNQLVEVKSDDSTIKLKYDKYGNMISKSYANDFKEEYTFDDSNQLIKTEDNYGRVVEYTYDALGDRLSKHEEYPYNYLTVVPKRDNDEEKEYNLESIIDKAINTVDKVIDNKYFCTVTDTSETIKEVDEEYINDITAENSKVLEVRNDKQSEVYTYGHTLIKSEIDNDKSYKIINQKLDIIGSVSDETLEEYSYTLDGTSESLSTPRFGYSSESHECSTQYLRARYYDTEVGVFISQDTYRGTDTNQLSQNRYIYTENNSPNAIDPSGHVLQREIHLDGGSGKKTFEIGNMIRDLVLSTIFPVPFEMFKIAKNISKWAQKSQQKATDKSEHNYHIDKLYLQLEKLERDLRNEGKSEEYIKNARLQHIRKYCEKENLNTASTIKEVAEYKAKLDEAYKNWKLYGNMENEVGILFGREYYKNFEYNPDRVAYREKVMSGVELAGVLLTVAVAASGSFTFILANTGAVYMSAFISGALGTSITVSGSTVIYSGLVTLLVGALNAISIIPNIEDPAVKSALNDINAFGMFLGLQGLMSDVINRYTQGTGKTPEDLVSNATETTDGSSKITRNFEKSGDYSIAEAEFNSLNPENVKDIQTQYGPGKHGTLSDGTSVSVRPGSGTGGSTIEIRFSGNKVWKIRFK